MVHLGLEPGHLRLVFAPVATGDAIFVDTGSALYLVDCGAGLDYGQAVRAIGYPSIAGLILTHAHLDHWAGLPEALGSLAPDGWVARSGTTLSPELMSSQATFEFYSGTIDRERVVEAWNAIPSRGIPPGQPLWDANIARSAPLVELSSPDPRAVHHACIVPVLCWGTRTVVLGADLDGDDWEALAPELPSPIDVLQAPNHGGPPGRMERWVLDEHLRPSVVVVTDAQPFVNDHVAWYSSAGRRVVTLQERRPIVVTIPPSGSNVAIGTMDLCLTA